MKAVRFTPEMVEENLSKGYWTREIRADVFDANARKFPDREALVDPRIRMTWAEAKTAMDRIALGFLELGIKRDEVVVSQLPNCVEHVLLKLALGKAGILIHPSRQPAEFEYVLNATGAVAVVGPLQWEGTDWAARVQGLRAGLPALRQILVVGDSTPPGTASIREMMAAPLEKKYPENYLDGTKFHFSETTSIGTTGGSTGLPKLTEWSDAPYLAFGKVLVRRLKVKAEDTVAILDGPLFYMASACILDGTPQAGARIVMAGSSDPSEGLKLIAQERATIAGSSSVTLIGLIRHPDFGKYDLSSLKAFLWVGPLPHAIAREAEEKLGCPLVTCYGSADAGVLTIGAVDSPAHVRLLTAGRPLDGEEMRLIDEDGNGVASGEAGEVIVRGPYSNPGYFKKPEATRQAWEGPDGEAWFKTSDIGKLDRDYNLTILGRRADVIRSRGQSIYPVEVENLLLTHPSVFMASVVGLPGTGNGEQICACVVLQPGKGLNMREMTSFLQGAGLVSYKLPHRLEIMDKLPTTGDGLKISKKALVEQLSRRA